MANRPNGQYITREEAAEMLRVSVRTIDRYIEKKILKAYRSKVGLGRGGRRIYLKRVDVESLRDNPLAPYE